MQIDRIGSFDDTRVMGVLNVTPDSFSDGGMWNTVEKAVDHALQMQSQGADIIDIGGESTRPGAERVSVEEEKRRVIPVIKEYLVRAENPLPISIDTVNRETAAAAVEAGASLVNDISGGQFDPGMYDFIASSGVPYICQHIVGNPQNMDANIDYSPNVVSAVVAFFEKRLELMSKSGIGEEQMILDPGLGFAKSQDQCWEILRNLESVKELGLPILIGASRKRFTRLAEPKNLESDSISLANLDEITAVISALAANMGIWAVRVHNVAKTVRALAVVKKWRDNV